MLLQGEVSAFLLYPWVSRVLSAPSVRVANSQVSSPEAAPEHRILLIVEALDGGGRGWGLKSPTWVEFFVVLDEQRATQGTWDAMGFLFGRHSPMALCSMVVQASPQASCLQSSSVMAIPSGCFLIANSSPLPWSALQTPHFSTQPLSALVDMPLRLGGQGWGQHPVCRSHSVLLPHAGCHVFFPQRMRLSFSPN